MYLQFINNDNKYPIYEEDIKYMGNNKIFFYNSNIPINNNGFNIYLEDEDVVDLQSSYDQINTVYGATTSDSYYNLKDHNVLQYEIQNVHQKHNLFLLQLIYLFL